MCLKRSAGFWLTRITLFIVFAVGWMTTSKPTVGAGEPRETSKPLTPDEKEEVNKAIKRGVVFLRRSQLKTGAWADGPTSNQKGGTVDAKAWPVGYTALAGLTLLECGEPGADPSIQEAARFVRANIPNQSRTYEISLALVFLDRLGEAGDRPLIHRLALRLAAGQGPIGGWGYNCPMLTPAQEKSFLETLRKRKAEEVPKKFAAPDRMGPMEKADNSNTQFAMLALWAARKHDVPLEATFAGIAARFRSSQRTEGWGYRLGIPKTSGAMTCVGLLGLAMGRGSEKGPAEPGDAEEDEGIASGLRALAKSLDDPSDAQAWAGAALLGPKGKLNLYFLWSVERIGVLCDIKTIGGKDWYRWGVKLLLPQQAGDGSWIGRGAGGSPVVDTCFALLFLKRSDLLPDLRKSLQKRVSITDPGLSPGEKSEVKKK